MKKKTKVGDGEIELEDEARALVLAIQELTKELRRFNNK